MPDERSNAPEISSPLERRSKVVFSAMLLLAMLAVAFPEMPSQALLGILWTGAGLLMVLFPPEVKIPRIWCLLAAGFGLFSVMGFLPRGWFAIPAWRTELEHLGVDTGPYVWVQARFAAEGLMGFLASAAVVVFLLGHRVRTQAQQHLALAFTLGVGLWAAAALKWHEPGAVFGFFPNRNHTATLLAMGTFAGLGCFTQAIRHRTTWMAGLCALPVGACLYSLNVVSESRAGIVLVIVGFVVWVSASGIRHLRGNVGKALLLILLAAGGIFLIVDTKVKARLSNSIEQMAPATTASAATPENPFASDSTAQLVLPKDGRITIFRDTVEMIRQGPWTGVGAAQFAQVFPQYRKTATAPNGSRCLHPESDWLMMMAEIGWPATLCLAGGVIAVFFSAFRCARNGRGRVLRVGCITAALLLCLHGIFDVPGHRIGLAWSGALLLTISLRRSEKNGATLRPARWSTYGWRGLGLALSFAGILLLHAQWVEKPLLPSAQVSQLMSEAKALYDQDQAAYDKAAAEGREYDPNPADDPLEKALLRLAEVNHLAPLEPHPYYVRGTLALHYDDKQDIAHQAFSIQRRLDPVQVDLVMEQAQAWMKQDPEQTLELWKEALRRASTEESRLPGSYFGVRSTYQKLVRSTANSEPLALAALQLAGNAPPLLVLWAESAPASLLDREMPRLLTDPGTIDARMEWFQIWEKRGSKDAATKFSGSHPELKLSRP